MSEEKKSKQKSLRCLEQDYKDLQEELKSLKKRVKKAKRAVEKHPDYEMPHEVVRCAGDDCNKMIDLDAPNEGENARGFYYMDIMCIKCFEKENKTVEHERMLSRALGLG